MRFSVVLVAVAVAAALADARPVSSWSAKRVARRAQPMAPPTCAEILTGAGMCVANSSDPLTDCCTQFVPAFDVCGNGSLLATTEVVMYGLAELDAPIVRAVAAGFTDLLTCPRACPPVRPPRPLVM